MLSPTLKKRALRAAFVGPSFVGLGSEIADGAIVECGDAAYSRQPVTFGDPYEDGSLCSIDNIEDVLFAAWAMDSPVEMAHWFITTAPEGDGDVLATGTMERIITPERGDTIRFWPGDLTISLADEEDSSGE